MRRLPLAVALVVIAAVLIGPATASAAPTRTCKSADMRYPFEPGGPKTFGVFELRITGGACTTARGVAKAWMDEFEANLRKGRVKLPRSVKGFAFTTLPANEPQTYRERGRKGKTTIRFNYVVPNG